MNWEQAVVGTFLQRIPKEIFPTIDWFLNRGILKEKFAPCELFGAELHLQYPMALAKNNRNGNMLIGDRTGQCLHLLDKAGRLKKAMKVPGVQPLPWGVAFLGDDKLVLADNADARFIILDLEGNILLHATPEDFGAPTGVTLDREGNILVLTDSTNSLFMFSPEGLLLKRIKLACGSPVGVHVGLKTGNIYICAHSNHILILDPEGNEIKKFGKRGETHARLMYPDGIVTDANEKIVVADNGNRRVQIYSSEGVWEQSLDCGQYGKPCGVVIDPDGSIIVTLHETKNGGDMAIFK